MRKLLVAVLLAASPAWSAFSVGTPEFELRTTDCTTSCPMGTFTISGNGTLVILAMVRGAADSTPANGFACTVGGVSAPYVTGSSSDTGSASQTRNYEILPANLPGAGSQAVECGTPSGSITSVHLTMFQVNGLAGETAEAVAGANGTSADTTADSLNTITDGALVLYNIGYAADPGTVTAGVGQTELLNKSAQFDARWAHASYETGAAPAGATAGGTTHTSATTYRSRVAYAIAPPEVLITSGAVIECFCPGMFDVPAQALPDGQESAAYTDTQLTVFNGATPRTWDISAGSLPDGLSLSSAGVISGTPDAATAGSYNFTVEVTDADGGLAYRTLNIVVAVASGGALAFYEDAEDGNLTASPAWTAAGGCGVTSTAALEGADEVTKSTATDCTPFDGLNLPQVFIGFDTVNAAPATRQWQTVLGLGTAGAELFQVIRNANGGIHAKTAGQTGQEVGGVPRGFYLGTPLPLEDPESNAYVELHYIAGTGANATFRARINNGGIQEFSAGTATENFAKLVFRDANDNVSEDFVYDRIEAKDDDWPGRGPLTPVDPPPQGEPGPWVTGFIPQRIHYVTQNGTGTESGLDASNTEDFATALGHHTCGDLHIARAGTYSPPGGGNKMPLTYISQHCSESAPKVWKGYVDPATGQPENVIWPFGIQQPRRWHWFVGLHHDLDAVTECAIDGLQSRHAGVRMINGVVHDATHMNLAYWRTAGTSEPNQLVYGTVSYRPDVLGCLGQVQPSHPFYGQNHFPTDGHKYIVQNIFIEPYTKGGRRVWQANDTNGNRGVSGFWLEKNFFGDANHDTESVPEGATPGAAVLVAYSAAQPWDDEFDSSDRWVMKDNFFVDFFHSPALRESVHASDHQQPWVGQVTGNYYARANHIAGGYWGSVDAPEQMIFTGNEIYDPPSGYHLKLETVIDNQEDGPRGEFKISDGDTWNNNVYGGTFKARLWCNGSNFGDRTLAQWRSDTDGCRVTPASAVGFDIDSTNPANPTADKVTVVVNEYQCPVGCPFTDQARGNVYCVNWDGNSTCSADISPVVGPGKQYVVRYPRDFFGTPAAEGTCPGSGACNVSLPTRRTSGEASGKFANAYVITGQP